MTELELMTDDELRAFADQAKADTESAAQAQKNSEWHEACFAALLAACMEMNSRALGKTAGYLQ